MNKRIMATFSLFSGVALVFLLFVPFGQTAALDYPNRPIEVVVHSTPGGSVDAVIRLVNPKVSKILGVPLMIINMAAGSGTAAVETVVKAKPDGYTMLGGSHLIMASTPLIFPEVSYTYRSLLPIALCASAPNAIFVKSDSPFKTLRELLEFAKKNPGKLNYGSTGAAHISRVSMEVIKKSAGVDMVHIPYQGGGPLKSAILGGHVNVGCDTIVGMVPLVKAGNIRALAICSEKRHHELPEVPTVVELGYPNASLPIEVGYMAPPGTPQPILSKWIQATEKAMADPKVRSELEKSSLTPNYKPAEIMGDNLESAYRILSQWVKEGGLTTKQ